MTVPLFQHLSGRASDSSSYALLKSGEDSNENLFSDTRNPHDSLRPLNRSGDQRLRPRAGLGIEEIVGGLEMPRCEDWARPSNQFSLI
jgi:hypothetical protein